MKSFNTLVSATELQALIAASPAAAAPLLLDCGFDLADPGAGERAYAQGHLPGAFYLHLDRDLSGSKHPGGPRDAAFTGRHPLPEAGQLQSTLDALGFAPGRQVVAYDAQGGPYAARAWWLLRALGHEAVAVLDGGLAAWVSAAGALCQDAPARPAKAATQTPSPAPRLHALPTVNAAGLVAQLGQRRLVDARAAARFRGETEPLDPVAGHIPGALNRFFQLNLQADGRFKPAAQLRAEWAAMGITAHNANELVHQCGSGVTACHNLLAMAHAGLPGSALYPGSWSEWCADPARPVARG